MRAHSRMANIIDPRFVVCVEREHRFFLNFASVDEFEEWYVQLRPADRTLNEVVTCDTRKLVIDIDDGSAIMHMFDFERHVPARIRDVFFELGIGEPNVIVYRMADESNETSSAKLSYHVVVSNFTFTSQTCMGLCMIIASGQAWDHCVDTGIYRSVQCVRMEGSTKFGEKRWKRKCSDAFFRQGLLSCANGTVESDVRCDLVTSPFFTTRHDVFPRVDMSQFRRGKPNAHGSIPLYRTKPGYCPKCHRTHDKENASIKFVAGSPVFVCWRAMATTPRSRVSR